MKAGYPAKRACWGADALPCRKQIVRGASIRSLGLGEWWCRQSHTNLSPQCLPCILGKNHGNSQVFGFNLEVKRNFLWIFKALYPSFPAGPNRE